MPNIEDAQRTIARRDAEIRWLRQQNPDGIQTTWQELWDALQIALNEGEEEMEVFVELNN